MCFFQAIFKKLEPRMSKTPTDRNPFPDSQPLAPIQRWFNAVDRDHSGQINWEELQSALINCQGRRFSDTSCKLMIEMCDRDGSKTINCTEFQQLFGYVNQWMTVFRHYDKNKSGYIEEQELSRALLQMGYRFTPDFIKFLTSKYDMKKQGQISVDQFIEICVQIQRLTEAFRARDRDLKGAITIDYEDFLNVALNCYTT